MQIYVCVKQVPSTETKIKLKADASGIETADIKWILSPYDENAVEEAIRAKAKFEGSILTVISAGPGRIIESLRIALAMGADKAVQIELPESADSFLTAKALSAAIEKDKKPDFIFFGKEAIDDGSAQVPGLVASFLGYPCLTVVQAIEYGADRVKCKREVEGGAIEVIEATLPVCISAQKGLNEARFASIPNIMKAKQKEVKTYSLSDLGVSPTEQKIRFKDYELPPAKQAGIKLTGEPTQQVKELIRLLHEDRKVI